MGKNSASEPSRETCAAHRPLEEKIDTGFREMRGLFGDVNRRFDDLFRDLGAREEADKTQGREIRELKAELKKVPALVDDRVTTHCEACAINDITETAIKLPSRGRGRHEPAEGYDTPVHGTRRSHSIAPGGAVFKIPVPKIVIWLAVGIGIAVAAGGWAWGILRDEVGEIERPAVTAPSQPAAQRVMDGARRLDAAARATPPTDNP